MVRVTEVYRTDSGGLEDGRYWEQTELFGPVSGRAQLAFVEAGEELTTTTLFDVPSRQPGLVGWRVSLGISAPNRFRPGASWAWSDQVFVSLPGLGD